MAVRQFRITNDDSRSTGTTAAFNEIGPGNLLMDADAWLLSAASTIVMSGGSWTVTINGKVTSSNFAGAGNAAIYFSAAHSTLTIGASGEVSGYAAGVYSDNEGGVDITNRGTITSIRPDGYGIRETFVAGDYKIINSGTITSAFHAIDFTLDADGETHGTHTIINSGIIEGAVAIISITTNIEKVINSGSINGDIDLGGGNDTFTDFAKLKTHGKLVTHYGTVHGTIDLGDGIDHFNGGNNAETVQDNLGADTYKLGGGDDTYLAYFQTGADGVDTVDGSKGIDTYDVSAYDIPVIGSTAFDINLDKVAHAGIAANTATVLEETDHVLNFENAIGSFAGDTIYGNAAANHLFGERGGDFLYGGAGNDELHGGDGQDHLYGGAGRDILSGDSPHPGSGGDPTDHDTFVFLSVSDSGTTAATRDVITDFHTGGSIIDLFAIDAAKGAGDNNFEFIGQNPWGHQAGELRYIFTLKQTIIEADVNGDAKADFSIALDGHHTLTDEDFIL